MCSILIFHLNRKVKTLGLRWFLIFSSCWTCENPACWAPSGVSDLVVLGETQGWAFWTDSQVRWCCWSEDQRTTSSRTDLADCKEHMKILGIQKCGQNNRITVRCLEKKAPSALTAHRPLSTKSGQLVLKRQERLRNWMEKNSPHAGTPVCHWEFADRLPGGWRCHVHWDVTIAINGKQLAEGEKLELTTSKKQGKPEEKRDVRVTRPQLLQGPLRTISLNPHSSQGETDEETEAEGRRRGPRSHSLTGIFTFFLLLVSHDQSRFKHSFKIFFVKIYLF